MVTSMRDFYRPACNRYIARLAEVVTSQYLIARPEKKSKDI